MQVNPLPIYPEGRKPEIADRHIIVAAAAGTPVEISDLSFTGIYAWRNAYDYKISQLDDTIIISGICEGKKFLLPPLGTPSRIVDISIKAMSLLKNKKEDPPFLAVAPTWLTDGLKKMPNIRVFQDRADWDYIHKKVELAKLPGQKYHAKKNLIRQFNNKYDARVEELNAAKCAEAIEFSDRWCEQRNCESDNDLEKEKCAIYQMLTCFDELKLDGILVRVGGEIVAITIGGELNADTYVVHVEKGDHHLRGIYQFINQQLAQRIAPKYMWINRESDVGVEGLRRAKLSYHPDHFIEKYKIDFKA